MRILHLLASPFFSGPAEHMTHLALAQREAGHTVSVAVDRKRVKAGFEELAVPRLQALGLLDADEDALELSVKSSPLSVMADLARLRRRTVDVVHAHFSHDHLLARFARPRGAALIRSIHAPRSLRRSLPRADGYTVPAEALLALLPSAPAMVLPPLVPPAFSPAPDRTGVRKALGLSPDAQPIVGMVSTFQPSRRHALGLEAFARIRTQVPAAHLVLVGDGALEQELRRRAAGFGLRDAVTFAGYQSGDRFVQWLQAMDEVWILGLGNDWSGRAAAQARACGVRVVAVDEGGLPAFADAVLPMPSLKALVERAVRPDRVDREVPEIAQVASSVLELYGRARKARSQA